MSQKQKFIGTRYLPKIKHTPTHKLKEIIDNNGISHTGTDYGPILHELEEVLSERLARQSDIQHERQLKELHQIELKGAKECKKCGFTCPQDKAREFFYQSPNNRSKFRPKCKKCITEENKAFNKITRIKEDEIPF